MLWQSSVMWFVILAEGAVALPVTLSGGALFASWKLLQFPSSLIVKVILAIFMRASAQLCHDFVWSCYSPLCDLDICAAYLQAHASIHVLAHFHTYIFIWAWSFAYIHICIDSLKHLFRSTIYLCVFSIYIYNAYMYLFYTSAYTSYAYTAWMQYFWLAVLVILQGAQGSW